MYGLFLMIMVPVCFEAALWILQYRPYQQQAYSIQANPEDAVVGHPRLGFGLSPGSFQVTINQGLKYEVTHNPDSQRITSNLPLDSLPEIWLFGCSYTYGMGVDDDETFAWKLQEKYPEQQVINFGVPGYGTVQSLLQLIIAWKNRGTPAVVVLNFADFHGERNVLSPRYRKALSVGYRQAGHQHDSLMGQSQIPHADLQEGHLSIMWENWDELYQDWWGRDLFCSVNFWQTFADNIHLFDLRPDSVTCQLIFEMNRLCQTKEVPFLVTGLTSTQATNTILLKLREQNINAVDISLDLNLPEYTHYPYDTHPNASAHAKFSERLHTRLGLLLSEQEY